MQSVLRALLSAVIVVTASPAASADSPDSAQAEALFKEGRRLMAAGDYAAACTKFADSQAIEPAPGTVLNLATCYEKAGKLASAWAAFRAAQATAESAKQGERANAARKRADELESKLSRLVLLVPPEAQVLGLEVRLDGAPVRQPEWGVATPRDGGGHDIEASAPGKKPWAAHVELAASEQDATIDVPPLQNDAPAPSQAVAVTAPAPKEALVEKSPPVVAAHRGDTRRIIALSLGGVGLVGIGVGAYAGLTAQSKYDDAVRLCTGSPPRCPAGSPAFAQRESAVTWGTVSTIAFAAGGTALAAGAVLYFLPLGDAKTTTVAVAPAPGGGAVSFAGRF